jgi:hypothetical protein
MIIKVFILRILLIKTLKEKGLLILSPKLKIENLGNFQSIKDIISKLNIENNFAGQKIFATCITNNLNYNYEYNFNYSTKKYQMKDSNTKLYENWAYSKYK